MIEPRRFGRISRNTSCESLRAGRPRRLDELPVRQRHRLAADHPRQVRPAERADHHDQQHRPVPGRQRRQDRDHEDQRRERHQEVHHAGRSPGRPSRGRTRRACRARRRGSWSARSQTMTMVIDTRAPYTIRANRSRPFCGSTPNQCRAADPAERPVRYAAEVGVDRRRVELVRPPAAELGDQRRGDRHQDHDRQEQQARERALVPGDRGEDPPARGGRCRRRHRLLNLDEGRAGRHDSPHPRFPSLTCCCPSARPTRGRCRPRTRRAGRRHQCCCRQASGPSRTAAGRPAPAP